MADAANNLVWIGEFSSRDCAPRVAVLTRAPPSTDCEMTGLNPYLRPNELKEGEEFLPDRILEASHRWNHLDGTWH